MEPQVIDYYNEMPMGINVIEKMNEELAELQKNYDKLNKVVNKYRIPCFKVDTVEEYNEWTEKLEKFTEKIREIIKDEESGLMSVFNVAINKNDLYWNVDSLYGLYHKGYMELSYYRRPIGVKYVSIEDKIAEELNKLTEYKNEEWAYNRVKYSLKQILDYYQLDDIDNMDYDELSDRLDEIIMHVDNDVAFADEPILYCNFIPENCEENEEYPESSTTIYNIIYYDCEKCNKLGRYGEPENVDNKLLCAKCHLNTLYPGEY